MSDPYLASQLNYSFSVTFDMSAWVRVSRYPNGAEVYLTDAQYSGPLAIGIIVGNGRVVFTSFHHHAQPSGSDEDKLLAWLAALPGQHRLLLTSSGTHNRHRAPVRNQVVGRTRVPVGSVFRCRWGRAKAWGSSHSPGNRRITSGSACVTSAATRSLPPPNPPQVRR